MDTDVQTGSESSIDLASIRVPEGFSDAERAEWLKEAGIDTPTKPVAEEAASSSDKAAVTEPPAESKKSEPAQPAVKQPPALTGDEVARRVREELAARDTKPKEAAKADEDPEPLLSDEKYPDVPTWQKDHTAWLKREFKREAQAEAEAIYEAREKARVEKESQTAQQKTWESNEAEARKRIADYDTHKAIAADPKRFPYNETALKFVLDSKVGPDLLVHFVKAGEQAWRELTALPAHQIVRAMTLVEAELERGLTPSNGTPQARDKDGKFVEASKPKTLTSSSAPVRSLDGNPPPPENEEESLAKAASDGDEAASERWLALRNRRLAKERTG